MKTEKGKFIVSGMLMVIVILFSGSLVVQAADIVKIGVLGPMTGGAAIVGIDQLRGIQVGANEVNDRGGVKAGNKFYKVEIIDMDDGAVAANSVANARRMVALHKVSVILGPPISSCVFAIMQFNEEKGKEFLINTMAMHPDITKRGNKLIVRHTCPTDLVRQMVEAMVKLKKQKSAAIIHHTDDWGMNWKNGILDALKEMGGKVTTIEGIDERKQTDFYPQLTKIVKTNPDGIFIVAHEGAGTIMIKQVREIGYKGRLLFTEGFGEPGRKLVGTHLIEGCLFVANPQDLGKPNAKRYVEKFNKMFPNEMTQVYGCLAYTQFGVIINAMEKAQNVKDPYKIREAVPKILPMSGYCFDIEKCGENGESPAPYVVGEMKRGKVIEAQPE